MEESEGRTGRPCRPYGHSKDVVLSERNGPAGFSAEENPPLLKETL